MSTENVESSGDQGSAADQQGGREKSVSESRENVDSSAAVAVASERAADAGAGSESADERTASGYDVDSFFDRHGLKSKFEGKSSDEILGALHDGFQRGERLSQVEQQLSQIMPVYQQLLSERLKSDRAASTDEPVKTSGDGDPWYSSVDSYRPIDQDPLFDSFLDRSADGSSTWKEGTPSEVIQKYHQAEHARRERLLQLATNPGEFFNPLVQNLEQRIEKMIDERLNHNLAEIGEDDAVSQFRENNAHWMFERTSDGNVATRLNPNTGEHEPVPSRLGSLFERFAVEGAQFGITNRVALIQYADRRLREHAMMVKAQLASEGGAETSGEDAAAAAAEQTKLEADRLKSEALDRGRATVERNTGGGKKAPPSSADEGRRTVNDVLKSMRREREQELAGTA